MHVAVRALVCGFLFFTVAGCVRDGLQRSSAETTVYCTATAPVTTFDPVRAGDPASLAAVGRVYEGLYQAAYEARPYHVEPILAAAKPVAIDEGRTYRIQVREGRVFHDDPCFADSGGRGREVVATDIVYSLMRVADAANESPGFYAFNNQIVGLNAWRDRRRAGDAVDYDTAVPGLRAVDRYTVEIRLNQPYPMLLWALTLPAASIVPREAVELYGDGFGAHPVGTGPYVLASWRPHVHAKYERNPGWVPGPGSAGDEVTGRTIDRIVNYVVPDGAVRWQLFLNETFAVSDIPEGLAPGIVDAGGALRAPLAERGIVLARDPTWIARYIGFNLDDSVVGPNRLLRQAIAHAMDWQAWHEAPNAPVRTTEGPLPVTLAGPFAGTPRYPFDLERARRLLIQAGYPGGMNPRTAQPLVLAIDVGPAARARDRWEVDQLTQWMEAIGIRLQPVFTDRDTFHKRLTRGDVQLYRFSWLSDMPDAETYLALFFSENAPPGANYWRINHVELDRLFRRYRALNSRAERSRTARDIVRIVNDELPCLNAGTPMAVEARHAWVANKRHHDFARSVEAELWLHGTRTEPAAGEEGR